MKRLPRTRTLATSAVIASAAVGVLEATGMTLVGEPAGGFGRGLAAWGSSAALAALGALPVTILLLLVIAVLARLRLGREVRRDLSAGGAARAIVLWRCLLAGLAIGAFAYLSFRLSAWTYDAYPDREPPLFGSFIAAAVTSFAVLAALVAAALDRQLAPRIAAASWAARAVSGRSVIIVVVAFGVLSIVVPSVLLRIAIPDMHPVVSIGGCSLLVIVIAVRANGIGQSGRVQLAAVALFLGMISGLSLVSGSDAGRSRVVSRGLVSRTTFVGLSRSPLSDRDRDTYPSRFFGGADCDDSRRRYNPRGVEAPGNGIDENCTGADAPAEWVTERFTPRPPSVPDAPRHNILLVSVDCMRPDHTGAHGYARATTPTFDRLAASGTRFAWAFTVQPTTRLAIASLLTGRFPTTLLWRRRTDLLWKESNAASIPAVLKKAGYDTALFACCDRFAKLEDEYVGFDHHDTSPLVGYKGTPGRANSDLVAKGAIRWLGGRAAAGAAAPFFMWMHLIDPHTPYEVPEGGTRFGDEHMDRYDSEIEFADRNIGTILAKIDELGLTEKTIVVITADHGEEFLEHGIKFHSRSLFNQVARIPLVVRYPGAAPRVVHTPVSLMDVTPTLLDLIGVEGPAGMNGRSLAAAVRGTGEAPDRPVLMEVYPQKNIERDLIAVVHGTRKIIWDREANSFSLFSLADDPGDTRDLAAIEAGQLAEMKTILFDTIDRELATTLVMPASENKKKKGTTK